MYMYMGIGIFLALLSASCCLPFKKYSKNSTYIILNLLYVIPGIITALTYIISSNNAFYNIIESIKIPDTLVTIIMIFFWIFYVMGITFTILLHPLVQIIIFLFTLKNRLISKKYITITFVLSMLIAFVYLYLIWVKRLFVTA